MLRIILGIISLIYIVYIFYLRDKIKKESSIIYLREAPSKDSPAYVGKVLKERVDGNDIISTILDLNMRKYIDIEVQIIDGKEKRVLKNNSKNRKIELDEHEQYIINRLFRTSDTAILEDYINSSEFKKDFKTFDKILDKKTALRKNRKTKNIKQINKILFLSTFIVLGTFVFYALIEPISLLLKNTTRIKENIIIILSAILAISAFVAFLNLYIKKLTTSSNNANTIALNVAYILVFVVFGIVILCLKPDKIYNVLVSELSIVNVVFSFILAVLSLAYMLNIIKHEYKEKIVLYLLCLCAVIAFVLNSFVSMCIVIVILSLYSFYMVPKAFAYKDDDYIYKWLCFKKFLEDFSTLDMQEENAVRLWDKYLTYAISLGVNKKIIKKYSKLVYINLLTDDYYKKVYSEYME